MCMFFFCFVYDEGPQPKIVGMPFLFCKMCFLFCVPRPWDSSWGFSFYFSLESYFFFGFLYVELHKRRRS